MFSNTPIILFLPFFVCKEEESKKIYDTSIASTINNQTCANFNDICLKTGRDCFFFKKASKQYRPINKGVLMLINTSDIKVERNQTNLHVKNKRVFPCIGEREIFKPGFYVTVLIYMFLIFLLSLKVLSRKRKYHYSGMYPSPRVKTLLNVISNIYSDERFSNEKYNSLSEQYNNINNLEMSAFEKCFDNVNKFNKYCKSKIINCIINKSSINEEMKISLNCLYVSINIISKYIEDHPSSIFVSDSNLVCTFDGFSDMISSHHLAERICESILYAMCSLMKLSEKKVDQEFWTNKLERLILNDKISEENKLASCVILVQLDISKNDVIFQIADYLINKINIDCSQEYFGFSQSEILSARRNAEKKLESFSKTTENKCTHINKRN